MKSIEEEYDEYAVSDSVKERIDSPLYLILNIEDFFKQVERDETFILRAIRTNHIVGKILPRKKEIFDEQEKVLREMIQLADENLDYYIAIMEEIDDKNYKELLKLMDFLVTHYMGNRSYYDSQLEAIQQAIRGIEFCDYSKRNTRMDIQKLVAKKIGKIKEQKQLEKKRLI
ncbi:MAG: hypothetical protein IKF71_04045 [Bacilli bacterium]|nr:hypothetical protein [Bacilli bacterium]